MYSITINKQIKPNKSLINAIEQVNGWYIDWQQDHIKLSADHKSRLNDLKDFFDMFVKEV